MTTININRISVPATARNKRIYTNITSSGSSTSSSAGSSIDSNQFLNKDSSLLNYILDLPMVDGSGTALFRYDSSTDLIIFNKSVASNKEVIAWYNGLVDISTGIVDTTYSFPLVKDSSNNVKLVYDVSTMAIDVVKGLKSIVIGGSGTSDSSVYWANILEKPTFVTVATTGSYTDLINKPTLFNGSYNYLSNVPTSFTPSAHNQDWSTVTGKPTFATVATSGSYTDLSNKPSMFSGSYTDLTNKPSLFSGSYNDLTNKPSISTTIASMTDKASYFTGTDALNSLKLGGTNAANFYHSGNFNNSSTPITASTVNATTVIVNGWTIQITAGVLYFGYGGANKCKLDTAGNLTCTGDVTAYGSV